MTTNGLEVANSFAPRAATVLGDLHRGPPNGDDAVFVGVQPQFVDGHLCGLFQACSETLEGLPKYASGAFLSAARSVVVARYLASGAVVYIVW